MRLSRIIGCVIAFAALSLPALLISSRPGQSQSDVSRDLPPPSRPPFPSFGAGPSASMQPVEVELRTAQKKTIRLRIPRAYISSGEQAKDIYSGWVNLVVYLPGYLPNVLAAKAGYEMYGKKGLRSDSEVGILVKPYGRGLTEKLITGIKQRLAKSGVYDGKFEQYDEDRYARYFIPIDRDDVLIRCVAPPPKGELRGCGMKFSSHDDIFLEVSFKAKHLHQYEAIRKAVTELMSQFGPLPNTAS